MKQHKWHKEIKAWADGAEIEYRKIGSNKWRSELDEFPYWDSFIFEYRIKTQPQYLYVYKSAISHEPIITFGKSNDPLVETNFVAKIKIEVDDNGND
jgi:hypothetical protein